MSKDLDLVLEGVVKKSDDLVCRLVPLTITLKQLDEAEDEKWHTLSVVFKKIRTKFA